MPKKRDNSYLVYNNNTLLPEGIEFIFPKYAISWRNKWMLERSDYVVCYITRPFGGAAQFVEMAKKKQKTVINIADKDSVI